MIGNENFDEFVYITGGLAVLLGSFAAAAGIGGGGIYVPLFILVASLSPQLAVPRSACTMLGLGILNFIANVRKRHPTADRPLIEYNIVLALEPYLLQGTVFGVIFNHLFPAWLIIGLLVLILSYSAWRAFVNAWKLYKKEQNEILGLPTTTILFSESMKEGEHQRLLNINEHQFPPLPTRDSVPPPPTTTPVETTPSTTSVNASEADSVQREKEERRRKRKKRRATFYRENSFASDDDDKHKQSKAINAQAVADEDDDIWGPTKTPEERELAKLMKSEKKTLPWLQIFLLAIFEAGVVAYTLVKGPQGEKSIVGIEPCSTYFWIVIAATVPYFFVLMVVVALYLNWYHRKKERLNFPYLETDIRWSMKMVCFVPLIGLLAGTCAGLLGISSGMIVGPILLEMSIPPRVITATTSMMIIFAQASIVTQYILFDNISWQLGLFYFGVGATASILGQFILYLKNLISKRDSFLAVLMATVVLVSCALLLAVGIYREVLHPGNWGFQKICDHTH